MYRRAAAAGITANAVDDPAFCDFYTPAVFRRDALTLAVSTSGSFPGLSKALREALEAWLPERDAPLLRELLALRDAARADAPGRAERGEALRALLARFKRDYLDPAALSATGATGDRAGGNPADGGSPADAASTPRTIALER